MEPNKDNNLIYDNYQTVNLHNGEIVISEIPDVILNSSDKWSDCYDKLKKIEPTPNLAISFEKFTDGRGYSLAMRIKEKKFCNFLHAIGEINQELSYFLKRSGFDFAHFPFKKFNHKQQGKPLNYNEIIQPFSHHYQSTK